MPRFNLLTQTLPNGVRVDEEGTLINWGKGISVVTFNGEVVLDGADGKIYELTMNSEHGQACQNKFNTGEESLPTRKLHMERE